MRKLVSVNIVSDFKRKLFTGVAVALCVSSAGCGTTSAEEDTQSKGAALAAWPDFAMWPRTGGQYPIDVCFLQSTVSSPSPDWSGDKARVQSALTQTWDAYSGVAFAFQGDCPATIPASWMPIQLTYDSTNASAFGGSGRPGMGARQDPGVCVNNNCQVAFGYGSQYFEFETVAVHEVGHALGLRHERSRADFPGCYSLADNHFVSQELEPGPYLTATWDPESVMANWECSAIRIHDAFSYYQLSDGDKAGIAMLYPNGLARGVGSIGSRRGFSTISGPVIRSDGSVVTDWTAMGASTDVFQSVPQWSVRVVGSSSFTSVGPAYEVAASTLSAYAYDLVRFSYRDFRGRMNAGTSQVFVNDSLHTALLNTATDVL